MSAPPTREQLIAAGIIKAAPGSSGAEQAVPMFVAADPVKPVVIEVTSAETTQPLVTVVVEPPAPASNASPMVAEAVVEPVSAPPPEPVSVSQPEPRPESVAVAPAAPIAAPAAQPAPASEPRETAPAAETGPFRAVAPASDYFKLFEQAARPPVEKPDGDAGSTRTG